MPPSCANAPTKGLSRASFGAEAAPHPASDQQQNDFHSLSLFWLSSKWITARPQQQQVNRFSTLCCLLSPVSLPLVVPICPVVQFVCPTSVRVNVFWHDQVMFEIRGSVSCFKFFSVKRAFSLNFGTSWQQCWSCIYILINLIVFSLLQWILANSNFESKKTRLAFLQVIDECTLMHN